MLVYTSNGMTDRDLFQSILRPCRSSRALSAPSPSPQDPGVSLSGLVSGFERRDVRNDIRSGDESRLVSVRGSDFWNRPSLTRSGEAVPIHLILTVLDDSFIAFWSKRR
ncbi:hypothetical protein AG1IA_10316 [Rhizoctonia solani AG-1 IA]|uniref:Uncharacterized protein n=1 Tax=Thanatephorus cucumeris (strain AG1-IA) TaxID=983506 RepID=L8WGY9_THACA|nr:hypothetical protein AG1IA_10316 [Rhizoctonia solani AG-1 IA]